MTEAALRIRKNMPTSFDISAFEQLEENSKSSNGGDNDLDVQLNPLHPSKAYIKVLLEFNIYGYLNMK